MYGGDQQAREQLVPLAQPADSAKARRMNAIYGREVPTQNAALPERSAGGRPQGAAPAQHRQPAASPAAATVEQLAEQLGWEPEAASKALAGLGLDGERGLRAMGFLKQDRDAAHTAWRGEVQRWNDETLRTLTSEDLDAARFVLREYGSPELHAVFEAFGVGSHPAVARLLARVGHDLRNR